MKKLLIAAAVLIACASQALAIDFSKPIRGIDGKPFTDEKGASIDKSLGKFCEDALLAAYPDETSLEGTEKFKRWQLAAKIAKDGGKNVDLSVEELALVKKLVGKGYPPMIVGPVWLMLDPSAGK